MITNTPYFKFIQAEILNELDKANKHVIVAVSWLTDPVLYHKLYSLCRRNIKLEILLNYDQINLNSGLDFEKIKRVGGEIFWEYESERRLMHNKYCIIDSSTIITGSYNWTNKAKTNNENVIIIKNDLQLIDKFKIEFFRITNQAHHITIDTFSFIAENSNELPNYQSFLKWWDIINIELRILITETLFKNKFDFNSLPNEDECSLLLTTTGLDLNWSGYILDNYNTQIQEYKKDPGSLRTDYGYQLDKLDGIDYLSHLEYLDCSSNDIFDLTPLSKLKNLIFLNLRDNCRILKLFFDYEIDLTPLANLGKLECLNLNFNHNFKNFNILSNLKSLKTLDVSETNITVNEINILKLNLPNCEIITETVYDLEETDEYIENDFSNFEDDDLPF